MQDPELVNQLQREASGGVIRKRGRSLSIDRDRLRFAEYKVRVLEKDCVWYESRSTAWQRKTLRRTLELLELEPGSQQR